MLLHQEITGEILGAAFEVHRVLGPGFLETIYEKALAHELRLRGLEVERQVHVSIAYKRTPVGEHVLDLVVCRKVIIELKAISDLADIHKAIVLSYLHATNLEVAILLNFGRLSLQHKRIVNQETDGRAK